MLSKLHKSAPLPFVGQKRNFIKHYIRVLNELIPNDGEGWTVVDAFGGSGLLSHVAKRTKPQARVVYNDFDDYHVRLKNIDSTNSLRQQLASILSCCDRDKKLEVAVRLEVVSCLNAWQGFLDMRAVSSWLLFSGKHANTVQCLEKHALYNCIRRSDYPVVLGYLDGLNVVKSDFEKLLKPYFYDDKCLFVLDPPYICTQQGSYANDNYFGMVEFLRLMRMVRPPFMFFSSTRSELISYLDFVVKNKTENYASFKNYQRITVNAKVNATAKYEDNLIYKCKN